MFPVTITLNDAAQLNAVLAALNLAEQDAPAVTATEAIKAASNSAKATTAKKAEPVQQAPKETEAPSPEPTPTVADNSESSSTESNASAEVTYQVAASAVTNLSRTKGRDAAVDVLTKFGAKKLTEVAPENFAAVVAACQEALA